MQVSNIIGKQIFSQTGELLGVCLNVYVAKDFSRITALACADNEDDEFCLPTRAIRSMQDVIIASPIKMYAPKGVPVPIGNPAHSHLGESLGTVRDVFLGERMQLLVSKDGAETNYPLNQAIAGKTVVLYPTSELRPTTKTTSPTKEKRRTRVQSDKEVPPTMSAPIQKKEPAHMPPSPVPLHRLDLLGRTVKKSVYAIDGTAIVYAGERITPALIMKARRHNRLLQLTVNTLTNLS